MSIQTIFYKKIKQFMRKEIENKSDMPDVCDVCNTHGWVKKDHDKNKYPKNKRLLRTIFGCCCLTCYKKHLEKHKRC